MDVPKDQQLKGLKFVWSHVTFSVFALVIKRLTAANFISKSDKYRLIKLARKHYGISYSDFKV